MGTRNLVSRLDFNRGKIMTTKRQIIDFICVNIIGAIGASLIIYWVSKG